MSALTCHLWQSTGGNFADFYQFNNLSEKVTTK